MPYRKILRKNLHLFPEISIQWGRTIMSPSKMAVSSGAATSKLERLLSFFDRVLSKWGNTLSLEAASEPPSAKYSLYITGFQQWGDVKCSVDWNFDYAVILLKMFDVFLVVLRAECHVTLDCLKTEMASNLTADYCVHLLRELAYNEIFSANFDAEQRMKIADEYWQRSGDELAAKLAVLSWSDEPCPRNTPLSTPASVKEPENPVPDELIAVVKNALGLEKSPEKQEVTAVKTNSDNPEDAVNICLFREPGFTLPLHFSLGPKRKINVFKTNTCPYYWNETIKFFLDKLCELLAGDMQLEVVLSFVRNPEVSGSFTGDMGYVVRLSLSNWEWLVVYTDQPAIADFIDRNDLREQLHDFEASMLRNVYENLLKRLEVPEKLAPSLEVTNMKSIGKFAKCVTKLVQHMKQTLWFRTATDRGKSVWECKEWAETATFFWKCVEEEGDVSIAQMIFKQNEQHQLKSKKAAKLANQLGVDREVMMSMLVRPKDSLPPTKTSDHSERMRVGLKRRLA